MRRRFLGLTLLFVGLLGVFSTLTLLALHRAGVALVSLVGGAAIAWVGVAILARAGGARMRPEVSPLSDPEGLPARPADSS